MSGCAACDSVPWCAEVHSVLGVRMPDGRGVLCTKSGLGMVRAEVRVCGCERVHTVQVCVSWARVCPKCGRSPEGALGLPGGSCF